MTKDELDKHLDQHLLNITNTFTEALSEQRTAMLGEPEKAVRLLALEQMAQHYEAKGLGYGRMGDVYEMQECQHFAKKAREFADLIRSGEHP